MLSTTAAPRSLRRSPPLRCATTTSVRPSRPLQVGSSRSTDASPMATSMHAPGAAAFMPPCDFECRIGRHCLIPATSTTASCYRSSCTVATIRGVRCSGQRGGGERTGIFCATPTPISQRLSRLYANIGCRPATLARADCAPRGNSHRLRPDRRPAPRPAAGGELRHPQELQRLAELVGIDALALLQLADVALGERVEALRRACGAAAARSPAGSASGRWRAAQTAAASSRRRAPSGRCWRGSPRCAP